MYDATSRYHIASRLYTQWGNFHELTYSNFLGGIFDKLSRALSDK